MTQGVECDTSFVPSATTWTLEHSNLQTTSWNWLRSGEHVDTFLPLLPHLPACLLHFREPQQSSVTAKVAVIEEKLEDMGVTTLKPVIVDMR